jgi:DHA1 family bicyclomycin/chloramphenicol resistance-like MFS transporter
MTDSIDESLPCQATSQKSTLLKQQPYTHPTISSSARPANWFIIVLLGALSVITPFAVDMYLPAFSRIASEFKTTTSAISLSLSTYFIGFALGQIFYGPLLDRFGRKRPLYVGLTVYIAASLACAHPHNIQMLIAFRFLQAIGGCVAQVASVAMVRDFFPPAESARIFSLLFLMIGVSPLLAPTVGSLMIVWFGWQWIFVLLASIAALVLLLIFLFLPEGHTPDNAISLHPNDLVRNFGHILKQPQFLAYALAGAFSFAGLFAYVAGSPIIFMDGFHLSAKAFGGVFATLTMGFIGGNQINVFLLRTFSSKQIFSAALTVQVLTGLVFLAASRLGWLGIPGTLILFFVFLTCIGLTYPNAAALALAPFSRNMGSASALLGFIQMGTGAVVSTGIGLLGATAVVALLSGTALLALLIFGIGRRSLPETITADESELTILVH